jgi:hypothetical protein
MEKVGIFYGHVEYFTIVWYILWPFGNVVIIWYIFPCFGVLCQGKSGNPVVDIHTTDCRHQNFMYVDTKLRK